MKKSMKLASRGKRFAAGLIDMSVPFVAYLFMTFVLGMDILSQSSPYGYGNPFENGYGNDYNMPQSSGAIAGAFVITIALIAYIIAQFVLYAKAQSIGKAVLGLQVVSSTNGKPFGFWKMMLRECIVKSASSSVFFLGYLWILIDERNRGWHDKILDSYVVDLKETANMYHRAAESAFMAAPRPETPKPEAPRPEAPKPETPNKEDSVDKQLEAAGLKPAEPVKKVEAIEAPEKTEMLGVPKAEIVEAPIEKEIITAAGDEQTKNSIKEDDTEIK